MSKLRQQDVKTFKQLEKFAAPYGYKTNRYGKLRQQSWHGLAFDADGRVVYLKNGGVICERGMSFENCAVLIDIIGDPDKFNKLRAENKELRFDNQTSWIKMMSTAEENKKLKEMLMLAQHILKNYSHTFQKEDVAKYVEFSVKMDEVRNDKE